MAAAEALLGTLLLRGAINAIADAHQIISRRREGEYPADLLRLTMPQFAQQPHSFHPAKDLFDSLALSLIHPVAIVTSGALVDGATTVGVILRQVGSHVHVSRLSDEVVNVIALVSSQRYPVIGKIRLHGLRHTFGALLLQQGASLTYVKEQLGHASIQLTVDIYGHLIPGPDISFVDRLDEKPQKVETVTKPSATPAQPRENAETEIPFEVVDLIGGGAWTRTTDLRIMRPSL